MLPPLVGFPLRDELASSQVSDNEEGVVAAGDCLRHATSEHVSEGKSSRVISEASRHPRVYVADRATDTRGVFLQQNILLHQGGTPGG